MKNTIKTAIEECRRRFAEEGHNPMHQPTDNALFSMMGDVEAIKEALISSGRFREVERGMSAAKYKLKSLNYQTAINLPNLRVYESARQGSDPEVLRGINEGWSYSTIHPDTSVSGRRDSRDILNTIEDLLSVAEEKSIPMQVSLTPSRQNYDESSELCVYLP